jgi:hypothetical protein
MNDAAEMPHEPAPPEPRRLIPESQLLVRGLGLAGVAIGATWFVRTALRKSWLLAPAGACFAVVGVLASWAAAICLTGGEKFDDHPFV